MKPTESWAPYFGEVADICQRTVQLIATVAPCAEVIESRLCSDHSFLEREETFRLIARSSTIAAGQDALSGKSATEVAPDDDQRAGDGRVIYSILEIASLYDAIEQTFSRARAADVQPAFDVLYRQLEGEYDDKYRQPLAKLCCVHRVLQSFMNLAAASRVPMAETVPPKEAEKAARDIYTYVAIICGDEGLYENVPRFLFDMALCRRAAAEASVLWHTHSSTPFSDHSKPRALEHATDDLELAPLLNLWPEDHHEALKIVLADLRSRPRAKVLFLAIAKSYDKGIDTQRLKNAAWDSPVRELSFRKMIGRLENEYLEERRGEHGFSVLEKHGRWYAARNVATAVPQTSSRDGDSFISPPE